MYDKKSKGNEPGNVFFGRGAGRGGEEEKRRRRNMKEVKKSSKESNVSVEVLNNVFFFHPKFLFCENSFSVDGQLCALTLMEQFQILTVGG